MLIKNDLEIKLKLVESVQTDRYLLLLIITNYKRIEMDQSFENLFDLCDDIDTLGTFEIEDVLNNHETLPSLPKLRQIYWRNIIDPYELYSEEEFKQRYRLSKHTVLNGLLPELNDDLKGLDTRRGLPISPKMQLTIALQYYATGNTQLVCGQHIYISQSTVCRIIKRVSIALAKLHKKYIHFPRTRQQMIEVMEKFKSLPFSRKSYNYPGLNNIIGAIDCTHVKIKRPRNNSHSEIYRNRKGYFSINVQVVVGPDMEICDIVARWPGSAHDSRIFRSSKLHSHLNSMQLQGILVGDSAYRSSRFMLCPFISANTLPRQRYNYIQIGTRNIVERFFGVWKRRFACLQKGLSNKLSTNTNVIVACAVLHNIAKSFGDDFENVNEEELTQMLSLGEIPVQATRNSAEGLVFRDSIVNTFYT